MDARKQEQRRKTIAKRRSEMEQVKQKNSLLLLFMKDRLQDKNNIMMNRPQNSLIFRLHIRNLNKPNKSVQQLSPIFKSKSGTPRQYRSRKTVQKPATSTTTADRTSTSNHKERPSTVQRVPLQNTKVDHQSKPPPLRKSVRNHEVENFSDWWFWIILDGLLTASVCAILFSDEQDSGISNIHYGGVNVSAEVLAHKPMVKNMPKNMALKNMSTYFLRLYRWNRAVLRKMLCSPRNPSVFHLIH